MEELIGDTLRPKMTTAEVAPISLADIKKQLGKKDRIAIVKLSWSRGDTVEQLVEAAGLAPSAGNNQPWKWYFDSHCLWLFHDSHRAVSLAISEIWPLIWHWELRLRT